MKKIKVVLDRIEEDYGILITQEKKEIQVPVDLLPSKKEGDSFSVEVKSEEEAKASDEKLARTILNEILKDQ